MAQAELPSPAVPAVPARPATTTRTDAGWTWQAISGVVVLVLITVHMVANHFVVPEGLRNFEEVVAYLSNPIIVAIEVTFLVFVTWHALLGLRAVLYDFGFSPRTEQRISRILAVVGVLTVGYGLWLTSVIVGQS